MQRLKIKIAAKQHAMRLDLALVDADIGLSRRKIRRILDIGGVYINGTRVRIASRKVTAGDIVELAYQEDSLGSDRASNAQRPMTLDILYEDDAVLAINKPPGLPVQATQTQAIYHADRLLRQQLVARGDAALSRQLQLVHRLDKETTGILLFAKSKRSMEFLTEQFRERTIEKHYLAFIDGAFAPPVQVVSGHLSAIDPGSGKVRVVNKQGRYAETLFKLLAHHREAGVSLVSCFPKTGRSHQLRVHLESLGCPILGDKRYGDRPKAAAWVVALAREHHLLHAWQLSLQPAPEAPRLTLSAPLPASFVTMLEQLSWSALVGVR